MAFERRPVRLPDTLGYTMERDAAEPTTALPSAAGAAGVTEAAGMAEQAANEPIHWEILSKATRSARTPRRLLARLGDRFKLPARYAAARACSSSLSIQSTA